MKYLWTAGLVLTLAACDQAPNPAPEDVKVEAGSVGDAFDPATAEISLDASPQSDTQIRFVVTTNLPTPVEVRLG